MKPETKLLRAEIERRLGVPLNRCFLLDGSMRGFVQISLRPPCPLTGDRCGDGKAVREWAESRLGFRPFFCQSELNGRWQIDIEASKLTTP